MLSQKIAIPAGLHLNNQTNNVFMLGYLQQHVFWKQIFEIVLYLGNLILRAGQKHLEKKEQCYMASVSN